jgi:uncharacterized protein
MSLLATLKELQATLDNLRTIERDLSAFPPDLSALDQEQKSIAKQIVDAEKSLLEWRARRETSIKEHLEAQRLEELARKALKSATQKVQYAAAIREVDDRERQKAAAARPLKESEARCAELEERLASLKARSIDVEGRFKELHQIFLSEHETQVLAKDELTAKRQELESRIPAAELTRFQRLIHSRQGRAVVPVENSTCMGCRVKLRMIFLSDLRQKEGIMVCESCQRIVFLA